MEDNRQVGRRYKGPSLLKLLVDLITLLKRNISRRYIDRLNIISIQAIYFFHLEGRRATVESVKDWLELNYIFLVFRQCFDLIVFCAII